MQTRHRVPNVFTLYMVDVLCCALGCVILLWFLKFQEAGRRERAAAETGVRLTTAEAERDRVREEWERTSAKATALASERDRVRSDWQAALARAGAAEKDRDALRSNLRTAEERLASLDRELPVLRKRATATEELLAKKEKDAQDLQAQLAAARRQSAELDLQLRRERNRSQTVARGAEELAEHLRDTDARLKELRSQAELVPGLRADLRTMHERVGGMETRARQLEQDVGRQKDALAKASSAVELLQGEKRTLAEIVTRTRTAAENRFAGITLTGRRVVFLVDMSGSMEQVDERTPAPEKWSGVRQTLVKVMRSMPDLEKFQVILFADKPSFLLGGEGQWMEYDGRDSPDRVARSLADIKPLGNTNMYAAMEAAFRYRAMGMDTIYLLSDGLPNVGEGLSEEASRNMKDTEREDILSRHVRRTLALDWNRAGPGRPRVRINTIGFFYESPDVGAFLWALARENDGSFVGMSKP